jgi:GNAT superfamily N-acetyltransferase
VADLIVRSGTPDDIPRVVQLGLAFIREYASYLREEPAQIARMLQGLLDDGHLWLVLVDPDARAPHAAIIGMLGAYVVPHPLTGDRVVSELFWYVTYDARRGAGLRLLCSAESQARQLGAVEIHMAALVTNPRIAQLYETLGYTARDLTYVKGL